MGTRRKGEDTAQQDQAGAEAPAKDDATKDGATKDGGAATEPVGTEAAPLAAPTDQFAVSEPPPDSPAIKAVMGERHLAVVDEDGNEVDVAEVIVRDVPTGTLYRATKRIFERTTMPGTERPRLRLLYGQDAQVPREEFERLVEVLAERKAAQKDAQGGGQSE